MNIREILDLKIGGQWLVSPAARETIFCREMFSDEHKDIEKMIFDFAGEKIYPNIQKIEALDEDLSRSIMKDMGALGLIGVDTPEKYGGTELDKITACIVTEGVGFGGSSSFGCTFGVQTGIGSLGIVFFGTPEQKSKYIPRKYWREEASKETEIHEIRSSNSSSSNEEWEMVKRKEDTNKI